MAENLNSIAISPERLTVIGARGFVGSEIVTAAKERGFKVQELGSAEVDLLAHNAGEELLRALRPNGTLQRL
jgi:dTDP-4-dehydrorhamnose reductase